MLIVMHHRNVQLLFQFSFDVKTLRRFDVFQVDAAKGWLQRFYDLHKFFRVLFIDLNIEYINVSEDFEQYAFAFHDRLARFGANISQTQYCRSIADHRHQVSLCCVFINVFWVRMNFFTGLGYSRRIGQ